jgi:uncharacterized protein (TIGR02588 family)
MKMKKNALEWIVFAASAVLILCCVSLLIYRQLSGGGSPPSISVAAGEVIETSGGFAVAMRVENGGDTTAEEVDIEATLRWPGGEERGDITLAYVPYHSHRRAWIVFRRDPRTASLEARVVGYREP